MAALGAVCRFIVSSENKHLKTMTAFFALIFVYGHLKLPASKNLKKNNQRSFLVK